MSSKGKYNSLRNHELTKRNYFYHLILRKIDQMRSLKSSHEAQQISKEGCNYG